MPSSSHYTLTRRESSPPPSDAGFQNTVLSYVNNIRGQHRSSALIWDAKLAATALRKANSCHVDHSVSHLLSTREKWLTDDLRAHTERMPTHTGKSRYPLQPIGPQKPATPSMPGPMRRFCTMVVTVIKLITSRSWSGKEALELGVHGRLNSVRVTLIKIGGSTATSIQEAMLLDISMRM